MDYDCSCDYDPAEVYSATIRTARKQHKCYECSGTIIPGEKYEYVFGKWEGDVSYFKTCSHCVDLRMWVKNNLPCVCWSHGNMRDDLHENVREAAYRAHEETRGLRFGFLRRVVVIDKFNKSRKASLTTGYREI